VNESQDRRADGPFSSLRGNDEQGEDGDVLPWLVEFLATLIVSGSVAVAVTNAGIDFEMAWALRRSEPEFAKYWEKAVRLHRSGAMVAMPSGGAGPLQ
jgi:hypothetical protein